MLVFDIDTQRFFSFLHGCVWTVEFDLGQQASAPAQEELWFGAYKGGWGDQRKNGLRRDIDQYEVVWSSPDLAEELLARSAQESSRGAGQYFTPRPVIRTMCEVMQPTPDDCIWDPAAGTGGFLCNAYQYVLDRYESDLDRDEKRALQTDLAEGMELSPKVGRMCAMNAYLHGIGGDRVVVHTGHDSLSARWRDEYSMVLANPPFGKKQSLLFVNEEGDTEREEQVVVREDFWTSTGNKQLNFVQHIYTLLKIDGRAAVVVPDNVLFEGGAGEKVRRNLLEKCRVHTLLRLPTGIWICSGLIPRSLNALPLTICHRRRHSPVSNGSSRTIRNSSNGSVSAVRAVRSNDFVVNAAIKRNRHSERASNALLSSANELRDLRHKPRRATPRQTHRLQTARKSK